MGASRPHIAVWKERLAKALRDYPQTTRELADKAVPDRAALKLLTELARERRALRRTLVRAQAGGFAPAGWSLPMAELEEA